MRTSGFNPEDNICWQFNNPGDTRLRCKCPAHAKGYGERLLATFGRYRSGQRWFWRAGIYLDKQDRMANGLAETEQAAMDAAMSAIRGFRDEQPILAQARHGWASRELREINAAKRRARPASQAKGAPVVEYIYSWNRDYDDYDRCTHDYIYRYPVTKRTAKRLFYLNKGVRIDAQGEPIAKYNNIHDFTPTEPAFLDRAKFEAEGEIWSRPSRKHFYVSFEAMMAVVTRHHRKPIDKADLAALKEAMAAAHPDKGGSSAAFIEARAAYVTARRMQRGAA